MEQESKLYISASIADSLPSMVKNELAKLPAQKQEEFVEEYKRKAKSVGIAYLFLIVILAMHYGYLRKWGLQIVFWLTGGGFFIWWLIDLFRLAGLVKNYNKDVATDTMRNLKAMSS
jgi:hypothetical protein